MGPSFAPGLALAVLVLLAGCSGFIGQPGQEPSSFAPGVTNDRVTNATALEAAHRTILGNTSYTYVSNYTQRVDAEGYHYAVDHDTRVWVAADGSFRSHHRSVVTGGDHPSECVEGVWTNGSIAVTRTVDVANGTVRYTRYRPPAPYPASSATRSDITGSLGDGRLTAT